MKVFSLFFQNLFNKFEVAIISGNRNGNFKLDNLDGEGLQLFNLYAKEKILDFEEDPNTYELRVSLKLFFFFLKKIIT